VTVSLHIEKLHRTHVVDHFTCGQPELDRFLIRHALQAQQANSSQTYVAIGDGEVVGFAAVTLITISKMEGKMDTYTKVVFTVIAIALSVIALAGC